jgi:hypothetical protein
MPSGWPSPPRRSRDLRIDWLRGLAMTCVIVNHSKLPSLLSWFSYERFWVVTAAEVFVVLSGTVLGMVYGHRLVRDGWLVVVKALGRRALMLYGTFVLVTLSVLVISLAGIDVRSITTLDNRAAAWFLDPRSMNLAAWRDVALMRHGPWPFEIVGLYVWLVVLAVPCLIALDLVGWRPLLCASWALYFLYQIAPRRLTGGEFESVFPILAWQLLFVHGIAIGYHRDRVTALVARRAKLVAAIAGGATATFAVFALCNPWAEGPSWLHWGVVSPDRFAYLYGQYFALTDLGIARLLNLAVTLPLGYAVLAQCWTFARRFEIVFVTLGQRSLGAFVLHVYGLLALQHVRHGDDLWTNTFAQVMLIVGIAALLHGVERLRFSWRMRMVPAPRQLAA